MSYGGFEDTVLRRVFAFALNAPQANLANNPPVIFLESLAEELTAEGDAPADAEGHLLLSGDSLERAIMSRLSEPPADYPQWPLHYLLGCYARAAEETRSVSMLKIADDQQRLQETLLLARQLVVSYAGFVLLMNMFPQPEIAEKRGARQLLDALYAAEAAGGAPAFGGYDPSGGQLSSLLGLSPDAAELRTQITPMPANFLDDFAFRFKDEGFADALQSMAVPLMAHLASISLVGEWGPHLAVLERLVSSKHVAAALVQLSNWFPRSDSDGRAVEFQTLLGAAFGIAAVPDVAANPLLPPIRKPDPVEQLFPNPDSITMADANSAGMVVHTSMGRLQDALHRIIMSLLRNPDTKQRTLDWLSTALRQNAERAKMRPDARKAATDGFMSNVCAVYLRLCRPFLDPLAGKAWPRLDPRYPSDPAARGRSFEDDTRLGATHAEVTAWFEAKNEASSSASPNDKPGYREYHFICESFFLTASALRLGLVKSLETLNSVARSARHYAEDAEAPLPPGSNPMARAQLETLKRAAKRLKGVAIVLETMLREQVALDDALSFYRLLSAWLLRLACPSAAAGGPPTLPLPEPAPMQFASLPEYYVEDMCSLLMWISRARRELATAPVMEQFMLFFSVFLGSPAYLKNPYLRGRMVEVLHCFMPQDNERDDGRRGFNARRQRWAGTDEVATLFEVHPLVIRSMVRACISLYVDIERTDRHNAFYEKFNTRFQIGEILGYLWNLPPHRVAWRQVAASDPRLYVRFINMMINDSQHLLAEALEALPEVQETERLQEDQSRWESLPESERNERQEAMQQHRRVLQSDFALAEIYLETMRFTSEDPEVAARFFDVQVRDREARILNFFLRYLTLPAERVRLRLRKPEDYGWRPRDLIALLAGIHVNLYRADRSGWAQAVAADTDYYGKNPEIFSHLVGVLRPLALAGESEIADLEALAAAAAEAVAGTAAEEEAFDDVPEEFEDPVRCQLMLDPVKLPSGNVVDRGTILQHLLTDNRDPFSRAVMTEDDVEEMPELKARIQAWVEEQRSKRRANGAVVVVQGEVEPMQD